MLPDGTQKSAVCMLCRQVKPVIDHHYPLTREFGGTETIPVCRSCHRRDHQLFDRLVYEVKMGDIQIDLDGKDPYAERRAKIKAVLESRRLRQRLPLGTGE